MKYQFFNQFAQSSVFDKVQRISEILKEPHENWLKGSGATSIEIFNKDKGLVFFKIPEGIYIESLPQHTAPLIIEDQEAKPLTHYVGGEPMDVPDVCLCDEETAYSIMSYFVENGGALHPDYDWVNIYDYIADRYEE